MSSGIWGRQLCASGNDFDYSCIVCRKKEIRKGGRGAMPLSAGISFLIIILVSLTTFATRVIPFLIFPKGKEIPKVVQYLGKVLTPAVIGMLVVYCLKSTKVMEQPHGIPELAAVLVTVGLHVWKRNNLLSIGVGTVLYMFLIQAIF